MDRGETPDLYMMIEYKLVEIINDLKNIRMYLTEEIELEGIALRILDAALSVRSALDISSNLYKNYAMNIDIESNKDEDI